MNNIQPWPLGPTARPKLTTADAALPLVDGDMLELAQLVLDGPDETALYNQYGPLWRLATIGVGCEYGVKPDQTVGAW